MLRSEHAIVRYDYQRGTVHPDRLLQGRDQDYLPAAKACLRIYRDGVGQTRQALHRQVQVGLSRLPHCHPRRITAFCKLLDDHSEYASDPAAARKLRQQVFARGATLHPIVTRKEGIFENDIESARREVARSLGMSWKEIEAGMFADVIELQTLRAFPSRGDRETPETLTPGDLLSLYNVSQTQAALYRATQIRIDARADFKTILRHAKLAGLMHRIERIGTQAAAYRFVFDGPVSSMRETSRYGIRFAALLPKLLACQGWQMKARVIGPRGRIFSMSISPEDRLRSPLVPPDDFDSEMESKVMRTWDSSPVDGWTMTRETELMHQGQTVYTPDFALRNSATGQVIHIELVGYWTPEYLEEKSRRLQQFAWPRSKPGRESWLLMFPPPTAAKRSESFGDLGIPVITIRAKQSPQDWIDAAVGPSQDD